MKPTYAAVVILIAFLSIGCRSQAGFIRQYRQDLRPSMVRGDWDAVARSLKTSHGVVYKNEDRVMYWLNRGIALHYARKYKASSEVLFRAETEMQDLFTKSISEEIGKFVLTESIQTYTGEDYERTISYLYTTLNALKQNRLQDALVEARRADAFLQKMRVRFEGKDGLGTLYTQDAFILWLIGYLLEMGGDYTDAYLAYVDAQEAYKKVYAPEFGVPMPTYLVGDLYRAAILAGRHDEAARWKKENSDAEDSYKALTAGYAEVVVIQGHGEAPFKREQNFTTPLPDGYLLRVAIPQIVAAPEIKSGSRLLLGRSVVDFELAESVTAIAVKNFQKREKGIKARAIARAAIKFGVTKAVSEGVKGDASDTGRELLGNLLNIGGGLFSAAVEGADIRSWTLLPAEFRLARMWVPQGKYSLQVISVTKSGSYQSTLFRDQIELERGQRHVVSVRSLQ
ncbi:MAG: hypothetical protein KTR25_08610 [Myxococcales bacterium]|nr:hypothetical protein [Myxococcales bacterium]